MIMKFTDMKVWLTRKKINFVSYQDCTEDSLTEKNFHHNEIVTKEFSTYFCVLINNGNACWMMTLLDRLRISLEERVSNDFYISISSYFRVINLIRKIYQMSSWANCKA